MPLRKAYLGLAEASRIGDADGFSAEERKCRWQDSAGHEAKLAAGHPCIAVAEILCAHCTKATASEDLNSPCGKSVDVHSANQPKVPFLSYTHVVFVLVVQIKLRHTEKATYARQFRWNCVGS